MDVSRDITYSIVTLVNDTIVYLKVAKRVDLECSHHKQEMVIMWLDEAGGHFPIDKYIKPSPCKPSIHTTLCQVYLNKAGKNKQMETHNLKALLFSCPLTTPPPHLISIIRATWVGFQYESFVELHNQYSITEPDGRASSVPCSHTWLANPAPGTRFSRLGMEWFSRVFPAPAVVRLWSHSASPLTLSCQTPSSMRYLLCWPHRHYAL